MDADLSIVKQKAVDSSVHLDALRGLAAAVVFLSHGRGLFLAHGLRDALTSNHAAANTGVNALKAPSIGHEAVIAFFVLSGYFVGGSVLRAERRQRFSWSKYLFQRITRLAAVLVPALILGWALDSAGLHLLHSTQNIYSGPPGSEVAAGLAARLTPLTFLGNLLLRPGDPYPLSRHQSTPLESRLRVLVLHLLSLVDHDLFGLPKDQPPPSCLGPARHARLLLWLATLQLLLALADRSRGRTIAHADQAPI